MSGPKSNNFNLNTGFIYIIKNNAHRNDLYKVGYTTKSINERLRDEYEENKGTYTPAELVPLAQFPVLNPKEAEKAVHKILSDYRYKGEWFDIEYKKLSLLIERALQKFIFTNEQVFGDYKPGKPIYGLMDTILIRIVNMNMVRIYLIGTPSLTQREKKGVELEGLISEVNKYSNLDKKRRIHIYCDWELLSSFKNIVKDISNKLKKEGYENFFFISSPNKRASYINKYISPLFKIFGNANIKKMKKNK